MDENNVTNRKYLASSLIGAILMVFYLVNMAIWVIRLTTSLHIQLTDVGKSFIHPFLFYALFTAMLVIILFSTIKSKLRKRLIQPYKILMVATFLIGLLMVIPDINTFARVYSHLGSGEEMGILLLQNISILFVVLTIGTNISRNLSFLYKPFFFVSLISAIILVIMMSNYWNDFTWHSLPVIFLLSWICFYMANERMME